MTKVKRKPVVIDIIGCGAVTQLYHVPIIKQLEKKGFFRVRYCIDKNLNASHLVASKFSQSLPLVLDSPEIDCCGADFALIATPPEFHIEWITSYLNSGANILVEKPAVKSLSEFHSVNELILKSGKQVLVGHFRRLYPSVLAAKLEIEKGIIGEIKHIDVYEGTRWDWPVNSRYPVESRWGGVILDTGAHSIDIALFLIDLKNLSNNILHIQRLEKEPKLEPSHSVNAKLILNSSFLGQIAINISLSRRITLANIIRVCGTEGKLIIRTGFAKEAVVHLKNKSFLLKFEQSCAAKSISHAFNLEYEPIIGGSCSELVSKLLCFENFELLSYILEILTNINE
jgi:predicted dehydrogenase